MQKILEQVQSLVGSYIPSLAGALAILVLGWIIALIVSAITRKALSRTSIDNKIAAWIAGEDKTKSIDVEKGVSKGVFYLIMLFVLVAFFQTLGITQITEPLNLFLKQLFEFAPKLLAAVALLAVAWVVASLLRMVVGKVLRATNIDQKLGSHVGLEEEKAVPLSKSLSDSVYWLVFLIFLPAILSPLGLDGILGPIQGMVDKILSFLPNIFSAAIIFTVGWFVARIVQRIVTNLLSAIGADKLIEKVGLSSVFGKQTLSGLIGMILYVFILIPVLIAALNALAIEAITEPASEMLNTILVKVPDIFAAILVLAIAYLIGKMLSTLIANLLSGIGFDSVLVWIGFQKEVQTGQNSPSTIAGYLMLVVIMLFASIEASDLLGFAALSDLISQLTIFASHIVFGLIIFGVGLFLANLIAKTLHTTSSKYAPFLATAARVAIVVLVSAMALRQMGLANEIINLAFGLILGAIAVSIAIAFGLGGKQIAAREIESWLDSFKSKKSKEVEKA